MSETTAEYLIDGGTKLPLLCTAPLESVLTTAKDRARLYPRSEVRVYKLVATLKSEVKEPDVTLKE